MCGIAGIFHYRDLDAKVDVELLRRMTRALRHRGPDDEGFYVRGPVGLGHRRLAIVDLTPTGHQPMATDDEAAWLTYNGEFYNHAPFRQRLASKGVRFRGTSDTETLLQLLVHEGPSALADTAGIFGFGFWDARKRQLLLARDPLGVKQIYYHDDGRRILFASEIKGLLQDPSVRREVDTNAVNEYLLFHTPLFDRTFFGGIRQVKPGSYLTVDSSGARETTYWRLTDFTTRDGSPEEQAGHLKELLQSVVSEQLMSDVPVGSFFSGGIDSSAVAAFATRGGKRPRCFGVHFTDQGVIDESPFQRAAAESIGVDLELITVDGSSFPSDFETTMYYQDQPVIGPAMFPMYYVSKLAAAKVKVCLGGQAADEIFGGYPRYAMTQPLSVIRNGMLRSLAGGGGSSAPGDARVGGNLVKSLFKPGNFRRMVRAFKYVRNWEDRFFDTMAKVPEAEWRRVFGPGVVSRQYCRAIFRDTIAASDAPDPGSKAMHWDLQTYLPGLFQQDDRMSMAHSLESRVPIADPRVVRLAFQTGFDLKFRDGASKWILRRAVSDVLPEFVLNRRKVGFDTPSVRWIRDLHYDFVRDTLLSRRALDRGLFDPDGLRALVNGPRGEHWFDTLWKVLCIEIWARTFIDGDGLRNFAPDMTESPREAALSAHRTQ